MLALCPGCLCWLLNFSTCPGSCLPAALPACLACVGSLPLVALAQLAAFVLQLVGRSFQDLHDLCPETFQAASEDPDAELVPDGQVQLSDSGMADLLGVPAFSLHIPAAHSSPDTGASTERGAADLAPLLRRGAQRIARYVATGSLVSGERDVLDWPSVGMQRRQRLLAPLPALLAALQQQVFLVRGHRALACHAAAAASPESPCPTLPP